MKFTNNIDKLGTAGIFLTALLSPCCFPLFAFVASLFGLGSTELFGGWTMWIFQAMVLISLIGIYISYRRHRCLYPLSVAVPSALLIFYAYHFDTSDYWTWILYAGMFGMLIATIWNFRRNKLHGSRKIELESIITCPHCGYAKKEIMPTNACTFFYECTNCHTRLKPKEGDCCVFCSYGTVPCPPVQEGENCC